MVIGREEGEGEGENVVENLKQSTVRKQVAAGWEFKVRLENILISEGVMYRLQWSLDLKMCPY